MIHDWTAFRSVILMDTQAPFSVMKSVPPRGSGWVEVSLHNHRLSIVRYTHPLPRGGTDLMTPRRSYCEQGCLKGQPWAGISERVIQHQGLTLKYYFSPEPAKS